MKKIFGIILIAASLAACNNKYKASSEDRADSLKMIKDSLTLDSFKRVEQAKVEAQKPVVVNHYSTTTTSTSTQATPAQQKKGWSSAAKGAVIGGAAGAIGGAIISKDKSKGAIIGGVAGAGTGYVIGRSKDKKDGRVN